MSMAEVAAANPSHTSATGSTVPAVASSAGSKSPPAIISSSPSSTPRVNPLQDHQLPQTAQHQHQQQQQQQQQPLPQQQPKQQQQHQHHQLSQHQHQQSQHQHQQQQQHHQPQQHPTSLPPPSYTASSPLVTGDGNLTSAFPQHWNQPGPMQFDRNARGLPPIMSPMMGIPPAHSNHDLRQPVSPRTVPLGLNDPGQDLVPQTGDLPTPRKRSKVSRACDECRRKKIRCDATSETGVESCTSCKRVGAKCSFSRVPMKRGPSKGYIKDLADRLNTLENSISTGDLHSYAPGAPSAPGEGEHSPRPSDTTSPPPVPAGTVKQGRKRTLSSSSDFHSALHLQPLTQQPLTPRPSERLPSIDSFHPQHPPRQLPPPPHQPPPPPPPPPPHQQQQQGTPAPPQHPNLPSSASSEPGAPYRPQLSPNGMGYWKGLSDSNRRASVSFPFEPIERPASSTSAGVSDSTAFEWDEELVNQYYELIHPTFPLLPHSKVILKSRLGDAPASMRLAFLEALYSTVRSNPASRVRGIPPVGGARRASELTLASQYDSASGQSFATNLIYLQTLILIGLEAENHGPATILGQSGPPRAAWLGAAVGLIYSMQLHSNRLARERLAVGDSDTDEKLGRRAWWTLVILDRWHAISTSSPLFIPDASVRLLSEDRNILGVVTYNIARLSCIVGHLAESIAVADDTTSTMSTVASKLLLRGELERFREDVEGLWSSGSLGLVEAAFYHVKLLALRHTEMWDTQQLLNPALRIADILSSAQNPTSPLSHHFAALTFGTLVDLTELKETKEDAWKGIEKLMEALERRQGSRAREEKDGWEKAIRDLIDKRRQTRFSVGSGSAASELLPGHGNLQHLAELAVGERSPTTPAAGTSYPTVPHIDVARLHRYGYLGSLVL